MPARYVYRADSSKPSAMSPQPGDIVGDRDNLGSPVLNGETAELLSDLLDSADEFPFVELAADMGEDGRYITALISSEYASNWHSHGTDDWAAGTPAFSGTVEVRVLVAP